MKFEDIDILHATIDYRDGACLDSFDIEQFLRKVPLRPRPLGFECSDGTWVFRVNDKIVATGSYVYNVIIYVTHPNGTERRLSPEETCEAVETQITECYTFHFEEISAYRNNHELDPFPIRLVERTSFYEEQK